MTYKYNAMYFCILAPQSCRNVPHFKACLKRACKLQILPCVWYETAFISSCYSQILPPTFKQAMPNQPFKHLELDPVPSEYAVNLNL